MNYCEALSELVLTLDKAGITYNEEAVKTLWKGIRVLNILKDCGISIAKVDKEHAIVCASVFDDESIKIIKEWIKK